MTYILSNKYINVELDDNEKYILLKKIIYNLQKNKHKIKSDDVKSLLVIGHPASMKTTFIKKYLKKTKTFNINNTIIIDADEIKKYMPDYIKNTNIDDKNITSKYIGDNATLYKWFNKKIINFFIKQKYYNLIIESVCSYDKYCINIIDMLIDNKYIVNIIGLHNNNLEQVKYLAKQRFKKTGRYINDKYIESSYNNNLKNINNIINLNKNRINKYEIITI